MTVISNGRVGDAGGWDDTPHYEVVDRDANLGWELIRQKMRNPPIPGMTQRFITYKSYHRMNYFIDPCRHVVVRQCIDHPEHMAWEGMVRAYQDSI